MDAIIDAWETALRTEDHAATTCRRYLSAVRAFVGWFEQQNQEPFVPARVTPIDLIGYRNHLHQHHTASTVNVHIAALRAFSAWLQAAGYSVHNPALRLKSVGRQVRLKPQALTSAQVNALLREAQQTRHPARDYAIMQVLLQTGIRIGECAALRLSDIAISERQGWLTVRAGKGNKERSVPLNASARQALAAYAGLLWGREPTVRVVAPAWRHDSHEPLWRSQKGGAMGVRAISGMVEELVIRCAARGLVPADTSAHTLRHTFATLYLTDHPSDLVGLAALLGHSTLETTRIYVQPSQEELGQRVEAMRLNAYE